MTVFDDFKATAESVIRRCTEVLAQHHQTSPEGEELPTSVYTQVVQVHIGLLAAASGAAEWWKNALGASTKKEVYNAMEAAKTFEEKAEEDSAKKTVDSTDEKSEQHVEGEIKALKAVKELLLAQ